MLDALNRIGGCGLENLKITGAAEQDGYRNKVQYPVQEQNGRAEAGFFSAGTHRVIPIAHCRIQPDCADAIRAAVLRWMAQYKIRAYDEKTGRGYIRHIYIRRGAVSGETLVCISANCKQLPRSAELTAAIRAAAPDVTSIVFTPNEKKGNTILGDTFLPLYGPGWIQDTLCGLTFRLSPAAFYQVNHDQAEILYRKALQFAALTGTETVLDLYCGTGTITLCLAREAGRAVGVEVVPQAIEDAKENAKRNGLADKTEFYCMDAGQAAQMFAASGERPDVIVVDPPRKGGTGFSYLGRSMFRATARPTIMSVRACGFVSAVLTVPMYLPLRRTATLSDRAMTSCSLWVMMMMALPSARMLRSTWKSLSVSCGVRTAVGSSRIRTSAPR